MSFGVTNQEILDGQFVIGTGGSYRSRTSLGCGCGTAGYGDAAAAGVGAGLGAFAALWPGLIAFGIVKLTGGKTSTALLVGGGMMALGALVGAGVGAATGTAVAAGAPAPARAASHQPGAPSLAPVYGVPTRTW